MGITSASFPGINAIYAVEATASLGVTPAVATVFCLPQATVASPDGTLTISDGISTVQWIGAHIDRTSITLNSNGQMVAATILDRRVWWKYSIVHGLYNLRGEDGEIVEGTEKSPQELAQILLTAMGETGFDVSALPNDSSDRPLAHWSCANPAAELARLCRERGCDVALNYATNATRIVRLGVGAAIPTDYVKSVSVDVDIGEVPGILRVCTGDVIVQAKFLLEAVVEDLDGEFKTFDEVSYAPSDWTQESPEALLPAEDEDVQQLANRSAYRVFRISAFSDESTQVPGLDLTLDDIRQVLPLNKHLAEVYDDPVQGKIHLNSYVEGEYLTLPRGVENTLATDGPVKMEVGFTLYGDTGYVVFHSPVFTLVEGGGFEPPTLYLTTSFRVRSNEDHQYIRYVRDRALGGVGVAAVSRPDLELRFIAQYDPEDPAVLTGVTNNQSAVNSAADAILDAAEAQFETVTAGHVVYNGIVAAPLDGITRQITWICHRETGPNTRVGRNSEPEFGIARAKERASQIAQWAREAENSELVQRRLDLSRRQGRV